MGWADGLGLVRGRVVARGLSVGQTTLWQDDVFGIFSFSFVDLTLTFLFCPFNGFMK